MSLQSELTRLQANATSISSSKDAIMTALASKGVTVPTGATLHDVPSLIGQINGSAPPPSYPSITFRFANSQFDPTSAEQVTLFDDADRWERVTGSEYNDWKFTANGTSIYNAFNQRFATSGPQYSQIVLSGATSVIATSNLDRLTNIASAFAHCNELTWTPNFDASNVTNCNGAFEECYYVTGYQLYQSLSSVSGITYNNLTFKEVADADQIPSAWGGTA